MTEEQAIAFYDSRAWSELNSLQRSRLQLGQDYLCMPVNVFRDALDEALGRPVWSQEIRTQNRSTLIDELNGKAQPPDMRQIMALLPSDKNFIALATPYVNHFTTP